MNDKSRNIRVLIFTIIFVLFIVSYKYIIVDHFIKYENIFKATFFIVYIYGLYKSFGLKKIPNKNKQKKALYYLAILSLVFFIIYFLFGKFFGFNNNALSYDIDKFLINTIFPVLFIISIELIRYIYMNLYKSHIDMIIITLLIIAYDILGSYNVYHFYDVKELYLLICLLIIPTIIKNCVLGYVSYNFGYIVPIIYRLIFEMYIIVMPIIPDVGNYINCVLLILTPFVFYLLCNSILNKGDDVKIDKRKELFNNIVFIAIALLLCALISGIFRYKLVSIGSESMSPSINKGDAVIIASYKNESDINIDDIIYFRSEDNNKYIVHRVINKNEEGYITKGDSNNAEDSFVVPYNNIRGKVVKVIPYIGYPSIKIQELISGG